MSYRFLVTDKFSESKQYLKKLLDLNAKRKSLQNTIYEEAKEMFLAQKTLKSCLLFWYLKNLGTKGLLALLLRD